MTQTAHQKRPLPGILPQSGYKLAKMPTGNPTADQVLSVADASGSVIALAWVDQAETDLTGYATEAYVAAAVEAIESILSTLATTAYVDDALAEIPPGIQTHSELLGLDDDDHTQYALADGSRGAFVPLAGGTMTGQLIVNGTSIRFNDGATSFGGVIKSTSNVQGVDGVVVRNKADTAFGALNAGSVGSSYNANTFNNGGCLNADFSAYRIILNKNDNGTIVAAANAKYGWSSATGMSFTATNDTSIGRASAGTVGIYQADGTTLGTLRVSTLDNPSAALTLGNATYGVSVASNIIVGAVSGSGSQVTFTDAAGSPYLSNYSNAGITVFGSNGSPGTSRCKDVITDPTGYIYWNSRGLISSSANGVIHVQNYDLDDSVNQVLAIGPATTSSNGVRLKRVVGGTTLNFRNGDDSADAAITAGAATFSGALNLAGITKTALLALTPNAATGGRWRVTDSSPAQREAYPDGTNWRYTSDDAIVT